MTGNGNLLIQEPPLQVIPTLAERIGLNEAIVLQQLHYWIQTMSRSGDERYRDDDGRVWIFNSVTEWHEQFPFWSKRTIRRILNSLAQQDLVDTRKEGPNGDQTTWYRIDYTAVGELSPPEGDPRQSVRGTPDNLSGDPRQSVRGRSLARGSETNTETTTESDDGARAGEDEPVDDRIRRVFDDHGFDLPISASQSLTKKLVGDMPGADDDQIVAYVDGKVAEVSASDEGYGARAAFRACREDSDDWRDFVSGTGSDEHPSGLSPEERWDPRVDVDEGELGWFDRQKRKARAKELGMLEGDEDDNGEGDEDDGDERICPDAPF